MKPELKKANAAPLASLALPKLLSEAEALAKKNGTRNTVVDVNFAGIDLSTHDFSSWVFMGCDFTKAKINGTNFQGVGFLHCQLPDDIHTVADTRWHYTSNGAEAPAPADEKAEPENEKAEDAPAPAAPPAAVPTPAPGK